MNYYFIAFFLGALISLLICKNFYILRKNQNAHIFSKMLSESINNLERKHSDKKGYLLMNAIQSEVDPCIDFLKKHEDFLPHNLKKWFQKSVLKSHRSYDYLNRFNSIKLDKDTVNGSFSCRGEKSFQYLSLSDLVIQLLLADNGFVWSRKLFCDSS